MGKDKELNLFVDWLRDNYDGYLCNNSNEEIISLWYKRLNEDKNSFHKAVVDNINSWLLQWLDLFPQGVKNKSGKLLRMDYKGCFKKMIKFVKDNPLYTKSIIFDATTEYLKEKAEEDYQYCRSANFFIEKQGEGSDLAAYCELVLNKPVVKKQTIRSEFI